MADTYAIDRKRTQDACVIFGIAAVLLLTATWLIPAYFESSTYNRLTGAETTWWDALWVELRVQESTK